MSEILLARYYPLLKAITGMCGTCRKRLLTKLAQDPEFVKCMREITENVLKENVELSVKDKRRLNRHAKVISSLRKSKGVTQSGGFLNIVVPLLASVVGELIASRVSK